MDGCSNSRHWAWVDTRETLTGDVFASSSFSIFFAFVNELLTWFIAHSCAETSKFYIYPAALAAYGCALYYSSCIDSENLGKDELSRISKK